MKGKQAGKEGRRKKMKRARREGGERKDSLLLE